MKQENLNILIKARQEGLEHLDKLIKSLEEAGGEAGEFKERADALNKELTELEKQQGLIDSFRRAKEETQKAARAYEEAQQKAQRLAQALRETEAPTQRQQAAFAKARAEVKKTEQAWHESHVRLSKLRPELQSAGINANKLADAQSKLWRETKQAQLSIAGLVNETTKARIATHAHAQASQQAADSHRKISEGVQSISTQMGALRNQMLSMVGINLGAHMLQDALATADAYKNIEARVKLVAGANTDLAEQMERIKQVAVDTYSSLEGTAELYTRIMRTGNMSSEQALEITRTINQAIQLSGASAQASEAAITQLVQGLQSGVLRGDEFNSVMEQSPRLAQALADGLGVSVGALREMAQQGELTSETVINALKGQSQQIQGEFEQLPVTIGRSLENLRTRWMELVGSLDSSLGVSSKLAEGINLIADNLDEIVGIAQRAGMVLAVALGVQAANALRAYTAQATLASGATALLSANINKIPKQVNIVVAATGFEIGWQIGEFLHENSELARKLGVRISEFFTLLVNDLRGLKEAAAAIFNDDTVEAAFERWKQRNIEITAIYGDLYKEAENAPEKIGQAAKSAATATGQMGEAAQLAGGQMRAAGQLGASGMGAIAGSTDSAKAAIEAMAKAAGVQLPAATQSANDLARSMAQAALASKEASDMAGKALPEAISKLRGGELAQFRSAYVGAMQAAAAESRGTARVLKEELAANFAKLTREEIDQYERKIQRAMQAGDRAAQQAARAIAAIGEQAAKSLGIDMEQHVQRMSAGFDSARQSLGVLLRDFDVLKAQGVDTSTVLAQALSKLLEEAKNQTDIDALVQKVKELRGELGSKVADGLLQQAAEQAEKLKDKMDEAKVGVNSVREAMKTLGITSDAELKKAAQTAKAAYDVIAGSGKASQRELAEAWKQMAEAAIQANGGVADATITAQAKVHGYAIEVDKAGKAAIRTLQEVQAAKEKAEGEQKAQQGPRIAVIEEDKNRPLVEARKLVEPRKLVQARPSNTPSKSVLSDPDRQPPKGVEIPAPDGWDTIETAEHKRYTERASTGAYSASCNQAQAPQQQWQSAWANQPQGATGMERVVRVNLSLGGQALGDVRTDEAGAAAIDRLMRELENGMRQSGRAAGR